MWAISYIVTAPGQSVLHMEHLVTLRLHGHCFRPLNMFGKWELALFWGWFSFLSLVTHSILVGKPIYLGGHWPLSWTHLCILCIQGQWKMGGGGTCPMCPLPESTYVSYRNRACMWKVWVSTYTFLMHKQEITYLWDAIIVGTGTSKQICWSKLKWYGCIV